MNPRNRSINSDPVRPVWARAADVLILLLALAAVYVTVFGGTTAGTVFSMSTQLTKERPVNIAHRGASAYAPEHTIAAYELALDMGADYVEQDLQLTKDGVLVCLHDATLERTTNVEDIFPGRSVAVASKQGTKHTWPVSDFTVSEIRQLDAGSWFSSKFIGEKIPTFQEVIDRVQRDERNVGLYFETKNPEEYDKLGLNMEKEVVRVLAANGFKSEAVRARTPVFVQSFSAKSLKRFRSLVGHTYPLVQLIGYPESDEMLTEKGIRQVSMYASGVGVALPILLDDLSKAFLIRQAGLELHPYTVNADRVPKKFLDASQYMTFLFNEVGATGVFTDNPDLFPLLR